MGVLLNRAIVMAAQAHAGQTDKVGEPYIFHPLRVAMSLNSEPERVVAVLHDVIEDSELEYKDLYTEFGSEIAVAVDLLSKKKGQNYMEYLKEIKQDKLALAVKIADIKDNASPIRLYKLDPMTRIRLREKYTRGLNYLEEN